MILDVLFAAVALIAEVKSESVSCSTLCNPMDYTAHQAPLHGILQARILEVIPFLCGSSGPRDRPRRLKGSPLFRPEGRNGP